MLHGKNALRRERLFIMIYYDTLYSFSDDLRGGISISVFTEDLSLFEECRKVITESPVQL